MKSIKGHPEGSVFLSGAVQKQYTWEHISSEHILVFVYSGELTIIYGKDSLCFQAGDTALVPKDQLTRVIKGPFRGQPFKAVSMLLPEVELKKHYNSKTYNKERTDAIAALRPVYPHPLLDSFFGSLLSYFETEDSLPASLVSLKIQEVLTIIDEGDKGISTVLGTFGALGKVDLEKYMKEHFMYNIPLERFAFLTGRSLTTFKSDFKKVFHKTPGRWLTEKRLGLAHYKLTTEKRKATEVYLSSGFENLSHFSYAFKKAYGYSPSSIANHRINATS